MIKAKPFIELLKRASKCRYKSIFMMNRMLMQCYNIDTDSSVGLHYCLPIPDTDDYDDKFYEMELVIVPKEILSKYNESHKIADGYRKEHKIKPKELVEEFSVDKGKHHVRLKFTYFVAGDLIATAEIKLDVIDPISIDMTNLLETYNDLKDRIKVGGFALTYDGRSKNLQNRIVECPEIYFYKAHVGKMIIRVPFSKSIFVGLTKLSKFEFTIVETILPDIYAYTVVLGKNGIEEIFWGYLLNY